MSNSQTSGTVIITAPLPARSIRRRCRPICRSRRTDRADAIGAAEAGAAILHLHARNPETGRPDQTPEAFARFLSRIKAADRRGDQHHHRRQPVHEGRGARPAGGTVQARGRLAQHGLDQLRPVSISPRNTRTFKHDWEQPAPRGHPRPRLPQLLQGHRVHPGDAATTTARDSSSNATTSAICTTWRISPTAAS